MKLARFGQYKQSVSSTVQTPHICVRFGCGPLTRTSHPVTRVVHFHGSLSQTIDLIFPHYTIQKKEGITILYYTHHKAENSATKPSTANLNDAQYASIHKTTACGCIRYDERPNVVLGVLSIQYQALGVGQ